MHILILINNLSYKKRYPYSLPSIQLWECPFSLPKGACYQSVEMLPIKWVNKVSCYCLIFICLIIIEMDHFFISLMDIYTPSFTNFLFEFFVNFLFGWLSFFKSLTSSFIMEAFSLKSGTKSPMSALKLISFKKF